MAIQPQRVAGIIALSIDGISYAVKGACKYRCNLVTRETVKAQSGIPGYKEMPQAGRIEANLVDSGDLSVALLAGITNSTVTAQLANGKAVTGAGMWQVEDIESDTEEGTLNVAFEGPLVEEFPL